MNNEKLQKEIEILHDFWLKANNESITIQPLKEVFKGGTYKSTKSGYMTDYIPGDFVMIEPQFMKELDNAEKELVAIIISELKLYNIFWYYEYDKSKRSYRNILSLRNKEILIKTSNDFVHIVNPKFIRKGDIKRVIVASKTLLDDVSELNEKLMKQLKVPDKASMDVFYNLQNAIRIK